MSKKCSFIISNSPEMWSKDTKNLFIADPYVYHVIERDGNIEHYELIEVAEYTRKSKHDLIFDNNFVDKKYEKYVELLSNRLNIIHGKNYKLEFWKKSFSLGFLRYITAFYDTFSICEKYFNPDIHSCNILSTKSYFTPNDFEDHRFCFQNSDFGQEQIFSIYVNSFYSGIFNEKNLRYNVVEKKRKSFVELIKSIKFIRLIFYKFKYGFFSNNIEIGILGSYFSKKNIKELFSKSKKKIAPLNITYYSFPEDNKYIPKSYEREFLSRYENDFDKFDKFFFASLKYCLPKIFVEYFDKIEKHFNKEIIKYPNLKYLVCENWISHSQNTLFVALSQNKLVKHIYNEHNSFFHPFAGSFTSHKIDMCDIYATLGWFDESSSKLVKTGSLFSFYENFSNKKINKILFVAAPSIVKTTHYSGAWGYAQENVPKSIRFNNLFFENLSKLTLNEILYRGYPKYKTKNIQMYSKEYYYNDFRNFLKYSNYKKSGKQEMADSELIIIDYISTAYLESLLMNIPTVFFWDENAYYVSDRYSDFFKPLIDVGICQIDPINAAKFIDDIKGDPDSWWLSEDVQKGKNAFLNTNLGDPKLMINYLTKLIK